MAAPNGMDSQLPQRHPASQGAPGFPGSYPHAYPPGQHNGWQAGHRMQPELPMSQQYNHQVPQQYSEQLPQQYSRQHSHPYQQRPQQTQEVGQPSPYGAAAASHPEVSYPGGVSPGYTSGPPSQAQAGLPHWSPQHQSIPTGGYQGMPPISVPPGALSGPFSSHQQGPVEGGQAAALPSGPGPEAGLQKATLAETQPKVNPAGHGPEMKRKSLSTRPPAAGVVGPVTQADGEPGGQCRDETRDGSRREGAKDQKKKDTEEQSGRGKGPFHVSGESPRHRRKGASSSVGDERVTGREVSAAPSDDEARPKRRVRFCFDDDALESSAKASAGGKYAMDDMSLGASRGCGEVKPQGILKKAGNYAADDLSVGKKSRGGAAGASGTQQKLTKKKAMTMDDSAVGRKKSVAFEDAPCKPKSKETVKVKEVANDDMGIGAFKRQATGINPRAARASKGAVARDDMGVMVRQPTGIRNKEAMKPFSRQPTGMRPKDAKATRTSKDDMVLGKSAGTLRADPGAPGVPKAIGSKDDNSLPRIDRGPGKLKNEAGSKSKRLVTRDDSDVAPRVSLGRSPTGGAEGLLAPWHQEKKALDRSATAGAEGLLGRKKGDAKHGPVAAGGGSAHHKSIHHHKADSHDKGTPSSLDDMAVGKRGGHANNQEAFPDSSAIQTKPGAELRPHLTTSRAKPAGPGGEVSRDGPGSGGRRGRQMAILDDSSIGVRSRHLHGGSDSEDGGSGQGEQVRQRGAFDDLEARWKEAKGMSGQPSGRPRSDVTSELTAGAPGRAAGMAEASSQTARSKVVPSLPPLPASSQGDLPWDNVGNVGQLVQVTQVRSDPVPQLGKSLRGYPQGAVVVLQQLSSEPDVASTTACQGLGTGGHAPGAPSHATGARLAAAPPGAVGAAEEEETEEGDGGAEEDCVLREDGEGEGSGEQAEGEDLEKASMLYDGVRVQDASTGHLREGSEGDRDWASEEEEVGRGDGLSVGEGEGQGVRAEIHALPHPMSLSVSEDGGVIEGQVIDVDDEDERHVDPGQLDEDDDGEVLQAEVLDSSEVGPASDDGYAKESPLLDDGAAFNPTAPTSRVWSADDMTISTAALTGPAHEAFLEPGSAVAGPGNSRLDGSEAALTASMASSGLAAKALVQRRVSLSRESRGSWDGSSQIVLGDDPEDGLSPYRASALGAPTARMGTRSAMGMGRIGGSPGNRFDGGHHQGGGSPGEKRSAARILSQVGGSPVHQNRGLAGAKVARDRQDGSGNSRGKSKHDVHKTDSRDGGEKVCRVTVGEGKKLAKEEAGTKSKKGAEGALGRFLRGITETDKGKEKEKKKSGAGGRRKAAKSASDDDGGSEPEMEFGRSKTSAVAPGQWRKGRQVQQGAQDPQDQEAEAEEVELGRSHTASRGEGRQRKGAEDEQGEMVLGRSRTATRGAGKQHLGEVRGKGLTLGGLDGEDGSRGDESLGGKLKRGTPRATDKGERGFKGPAGGDPGHAWGAKSGKVKVSFPPLDVGEVEDEDEAALEYGKKSRTPTGREGLGRGLGDPAPMERGESGTRHHTSQVFASKTPKGREGMGRELRGPSPGRVEERQAERRAPGAPASKTPRGREEGGRGSWEAEGGPDASVAKGVQRRAFVEESSSAGASARRAYADEPGPRRASQEGVEASASLRRVPAESSSGTSRVSRDEPQAKKSTTKPSGVRVSLDGKGKKSAEGQAGKVSRIMVGGTKPR